MSTNERVEKASTVHGEVEYEVVECCSCNNDVAKADAKRVVVGEPIKERERFGGKHKYEFGSYSHAAGWACPFCVDADSVADRVTVKNLAGFPDRDSIAYAAKVFSEYDAGMTIMGMVMSFALGLMIGFGMGATP